MLKHLRKFFNATEVDITLASANQQEELQTMTDQEKAALKAAEDKSAELSTALEAANASIAELTNKYEAVQAALSQSAEAQATLVANAKTATLTARTASLSAIMGDTKGPLMATSLESLDDAAFAVVLSGYSANFEAEAKSKMFQEAGVSADVVTTEVNAVTRLAANIAKEFKSE